VVRNSDAAYQIRGGIRNSSKPLTPLERHLENRIRYLAHSPSQTYQSSFSWKISERQIYGTWGVKSSSPACLCAALAYPQKSDSFFHHTNVSYHVKDFRIAETDFNEQR
jgi:hypothetical protein